MESAATAEQEAIALLTLSMYDGGSELVDLVNEFDPDGRDDLLLAVVSLCHAFASRPHEWSSPPTTT